MATRPGVAWMGRSGALYRYEVYDLSERWLSGLEGNYIYVRRLGDTWIPIYIGQGELARRASIDVHHRSSCLKSAGVTHVHAHWNDWETARLTEEQDLLDAYPEAYEPIGCNRKSGG